MKKSFKMLGMAAMVLLLAVSCKKENKEEAAGETKAMTFTAGISQGNGKTYLEGQKLLWSDGDKIKINDGIFTLAEGAGTNKGVFTGEAAEADVYYAVYPSSGTLSGNTATITLPAEQTYVNGSFGKDIAPMVAMTDYNKSFTFTNVCGLLRLDFANISKPFDKIVLKSAKEEYLAGEGTVAITGDGNESLVLTDASSNSKTITMTGTNAVTDGNQVVFVLPAGTLKNGFNVSFYAGDEKFATLSTSTDMEIEAGGMNIVTVNEEVKVQDALIESENVTTSSMSIPYEIKEECAAAKIECATDKDFENIVKSEVLDLNSLKSDPYAIGSVTFEGLQEATLYYVRILVKAISGSDYEPYCTIVAKTLGGEPEPTPEVPEGALPGLFTINSDGDQVYFSQGNLYWNGSAFKFEENQYGCYCDMFADLNPDHVSHFYWSSNAANARTHPCPDTPNAGDVFFTNSSDFSMCGSNKWFTLSGDTYNAHYENGIVYDANEWDYLLERTLADGGKAYTVTPVSHGTNNIEIDGNPYQGVFLYPDNYEGIRIGADGGPDTWDAINAAGIVFLPCAGDLSYNGIGNTSTGKYHSSSCYQGWELMQGYVRFTTATTPPSISVTSETINSNPNYRYGYCVRLVHPAK